MAKDTTTDIKPTQVAKSERGNRHFDHKDIEHLKRFVNQFGQIENRHRSSSNRNKPTLRVCEQKRLSQAIKRARFLALLPFASSDLEA